MSEEFDRYDAFVKRIEEKYPAMYANPYGGICVGEGWWPIIETLSQAIQSNIDWRNKRAAQHPDLGYKSVKQVTVAQIKEKFGGLRFYYDGGDEYIAGMVSMAEYLAEVTCEECGKPGKQRRGGWIKTLCDEHEEKRQQAYKERFKNVQP
jgi:hypothetical protein